VLDVDEIEQHLRESVRQWRRTLTTHSTEARLMLQRLVEGRIVMQPQEDEDGRYYEFSGVGTVLPLISGVLPHKLASPRGFETLCTVERERIVSAA